jgi:hypothetical protein
MRQQGPQCSAQAFLAERPRASVVQLTQRITEHGGHAKHVGRRAVQGFASEGAGQRRQFIHMRTGLYHGIVRVALTLAICLGTAHAAFAAVALVVGQTAVDNTQPFITDGTGVVTLPVACTVGNVIAVAAATNAGQTITLVEDDGAGGTNTYTQRSNLQGGGSTAEVWIYEAVCDRAASTVTVTMTATTNQGYLAVAEFSGLNTSDLFEAQQTYTDLASPYDSANITTTVADSLLWACIASDSAADFTNEADGWQTIDDNGSGVIAYKILSATVTTEQWNPTSAASENANAAVAVFNGTGGAVASPVCRFLTLLGVTACR